MRVTNSMRVTLPKELRRAVEAARLAADAGRRRAPRAIAPQLAILHDPAYLAVRHGGSIDGFSVLLRENRWPAGARPTSAR